MTIVGIRSSSFKGNDGEDVRGKNFYFTYPLEKGKGEGEGTDRVYLTEKRLSELDFVPAIGNEVEVEYNRYGKASGMRLIG